MNKQIVRELQQIGERKGGIVHAADVVAFARDEKTILHAHFEWDDGEAAKQHRLQQAREVIRVAVTVIRETGQTVQAFVSLEDDRLGGGGYRAVLDVVTDEQLRAQLLLQAKKELYRIGRKYRELEELTEVFSAIRKVA